MITKDIWSHWPRTNRSGRIDTTAPAAITDLAAETGSTAGSVDLTWTAPGEDGSTGTASSYLVRTSASAILTETDWDNATVVSNGIPTPQAAGAGEQMTVSDLTPGSTFYFSIRAQDEVPNIAELSNSPSAMAGSVTIDYHYDAHQRLTAADYSDGRFYHYTYDAAGNRLTAATLEGTVYYAYDDANRLISVGSVPYTYDDNGNLRSDGTNVYAYDFGGQALRHDHVCFQRPRSPPARDGSRLAFQAALPGLVSLKNRARTGAKRAVV
jgi:YD repeat-containing protein